MELTSYDKIDMSLGKLVFHLNLVDESLGSVCRSVQQTFEPRTMRNGLCAIEIKFELVRECLNIEVRQIRRCN